MNDPLRELADHHFQECCGIHLDDLTSPLGEANPAGPSLRGSALYREAGFPQIDNLPMPEHMPEETYFLQGGPGGEKQRLRRGFWFIARKTATTPAQPAAAGDAPEAPAAPK